MDLDDPMTNMTTQDQDAEIIGATERWIDRFVIGLNLCPFARKEVEDKGLYYQVFHGTCPDLLLDAVAKLLQLMKADPKIETALLIFPDALTDFYDYNDFLDHGDRLLDFLELRGTFQIASFHPEYQFADTSPGDAENYSNRSPFPMLHILREDSVTAAVTRHPDAEVIPLANMAKLKHLGVDHLAALHRQCTDATHPSNIAKPQD